MSKFERVLNQVGLRAVIKPSDELKRASPFVFDADLNAWVRTDSQKEDELLELLSDKDHEGFWWTW